MSDEIQLAVKEQEDIGLDVLVHGEAERNDMVEYFGQQLEGYVFTDYGWVQSYGSRCVKPPIIAGDVYRPEPMTVRWSQYAQSLTSKPMKGMLTGPITMLCWSFTREDISLKEQAFQLALALSEEVLDLEKAGINMIQVDEPALRGCVPVVGGEGSRQYADSYSYVLCRIQRHYSGHCGIRCRRYYHRNQPFKHGAAASI